MSHKRKHVQFLRLKNPAAFILPSTIIFNYSQNVLENCFWTYLTLWIQQYSWFLCTSLGLCAASQDVSWRVAENSEKLKVKFEIFKCSLVQTVHRSPDPRYVLFLLFSSRSPQLPFDHGCKPLKKAKIMVRAPASGAFIQGVLLGELVRLVHVR